MNIGFEQKYTKKKEEIEFLQILNNPDLKMSKSHT